MQRNTWSTHQETTPFLVPPSPAVMALGSQRRLQPTPAASAERIFGQLNFPCLAAFCFTDRPKLHRGICTLQLVRAGICQGPAAPVVLGCSDDGKRGYFTKCSHSLIGVFSQILYASSMSEESKVTFSCFKRILGVASSCHRNYSVLKSLSDGGNEPESGVSLMPAAARYLSVFSACHTSSWSTYLSPASSS